MNEIKIDKIIRSKRKSIALMMSPDATLVVRAPLLTPLKYIEDLVMKQSAWIHKKRQQVLKGGVPLPKKFVDGETFLFMGESYRLKIEDCNDIALTEYLVFPKKFLGRAQAKLIWWYKEKAFEMITEIANHYSQISGWKFKTINITSAKHRWGSCSWTGSINFSWKLIMAPIGVIDYVVVHELAHITQKNHSAKFWNQVKSILPDYKIRQKWLKENGKHLTL